MNILRVASGVHRALGGALMIGLCLWSASGLIVALLAGESAGDTKKFGIAPALPVQSYANPGGPIAQTPGATGLSLSLRFNRAAYVVEHPGGSALFDAKSGQKLSPLNEAAAREAASREFIGAGGIRSAVLVTSKSREYLGDLPVWRVQFNDRRQTVLYVSAGSGLVVARRDALTAIGDEALRLNRLDLDGDGRPDRPMALVLSVLITIFAMGVVARRITAESRATPSDDSKASGEGAS